jgi:group I intron endonuclease
MFIYLITNDANEKGYIGLHGGGDVQHRLKEHRDFARAGYRSALFNAIRKHGPGKFHITALWSGHVAPVKLKQLERYFISSLRTKTPDGYNLTNGGDGTFGYRHTEEERKRRSEKMRQQIASGNISNRGKKRTPEIRQKIAAIKTGMKYKPWSEQAHRNLSMARMGNKNQRKKWTAEEIMKREMTKRLKKKLTSAEEN